MGRQGAGPGRRIWWWRVRPLSGVFGGSGPQTPPGLPAVPHPGSVGRSLLILAAPIAGTLLVEPALALFDSALVAREGVRPLAAYGLGSMVAYVGIYVFAFFMEATTSIVGRALGGGSEKDALRLTSNQVLLALGLGAILAVAIFVSAGQLAIVLTPHESPLEPTVNTYLRIRAVGIPLFLVTFALHGAFRAHQDTRSPLVLTVLITVVHIGVAIRLVVFGGMGVSGVAWAEALTEVLGGIIFFWWFSRRHGKLVPAMRLPDWRLMARMGREYSPLILRNAALLVFFLATTLVSARLGETELAVHQVALRFWTFLTLILESISGASQVLISRFFGALDFPRLARAVKVTLQWAWGLSVLILVVLGLMSDLAAGVFVSASDEIRLLSSVLIAVAVLQPLGGTVYSLDAIILGLSRFGLVTIEMTGGAAVGAVLLALSAGFGWGLAGIWGAMAGFVITRAAIAGAAFARARSGVGF